MSAPFISRRLFSTAPRLLNGPPGLPSTGAPVVKLSGAFERLKKFGRPPGGRAAAPASAGGSIESNYQSAIGAFSGDAPRPQVQQQYQQQQQAGATSENSAEITPADLQSFEMKFNLGDTYAPDDLSLRAFKQRQFERRKGATKDAFDLLGIDPRMEYKNYQLLSEFTTSMGRIKHSDRTGLRPVNQRRMAKAVRRAVGLGLLPSTHYHPEILKDMHQRDMSRNRFN